VSKITTPLQIARTTPPKKIRTTADPRVAKKANPKQAAPAQESPKSTENQNFTVGVKHTVVKDDTLWGLAGRYYANPFKWEYIYNANLATIQTPNLIYPGDELNIPEKSQKMRPAAKPPATVVMAAPAETKPPDIAVVDTTLAADIATTTAEPVIAHKPVMKKKASSAAYDRADLSEEMPEDLAGWPDDTMIVSKDWREDGKITGKEDTADYPEGLAGPGDIIVLNMKSGITANPGDTFKTYTKGAIAFAKNGKRLGKELHQTGTVRVISVDGSKARARVIKTNNSVYSGQIIKAS
jgi:LysM repeat protein